MQQRRTSLLPRQSTQTSLTKSQEPTQSLKKRVSATSRISISNVIFSANQSQILSQTVSAKQMSSRCMLSNLIEQMTTKDVDEADQQLKIFKQVDFEISNISDNQFKYLYEKNPFFRRKMDYQIGDISRTKVVQKKNKTYCQEENVFSETTNLRLEKRVLKKKQMLFFEKWQPFITLRS